MSATQILGLVLLSLPALLVFGWVWYEEGFFVAAGLYAAITVFFTCIIAGSYLVVGQ